MATMVKHDTRRVVTTDDAEVGQWYQIVSTYEASALNGQLALCIEDSSTEHKQFAVFGNNVVYDPQSDDEFAVVECVEIAIQDAPPVQAAGD